MEGLPLYIGLTFALTTLLSVLLFYFATQKSTLVLFIITLWLILQGAIGLSGFYTKTDIIPPRFVLLVLPPLVSIILLFMTKRGMRFIQNIDVKTLTILHVVRIPVEIVLYWLYVEKAVPELMTFEGRNFDILSGISAPFIYYFGFVKRLLSNKIILLWNFICLGLLINIVINAVLSTPFQFQMFAFNQPNVAVLYFPFIWLPSCIVPIVLFSHLIAIKKLYSK